MNNYTILGIPNGSSKEGIKKDYRTLAKKHHLDKGGDKAMFIKIKNAYDELLEGNSGEQVRQQQTYSQQRSSNVGSMSVVSKRLTEEGDAKFEFKLVNVSYIEFNGGHYPIESNDRTGTITVDKETLEKINYNVKMRFVANDGLTLDKEWNVKKPLTKWKKFIKAITPSIFK